MRIIYIEDNLANVALIERICHMNDDELVTYSDAETALAEIGTGSADLILMDSESRQPQHGWASFDADASPEGS